MTEYRPAITGVLIDPELAQLYSERDFARAAIADMTSQLTALRERLDRALAAGEKHQAARGRATNAAQLAVVSMGSAVQALLAAGKNDDAAALQDAIRELQERTRG